MCQKGYRNGPGTEGFHMRPHLLQLAWSCGRTLETTLKKHLKRKKFPHVHTTMATPLQLSVEIAFCSRCELPFCTAFPFFRGVNEGNYNFWGQETFL